MFVFRIDSIVDIITNSSSELFIMKAEGKDVLIELIESVLPEFRETYEEPILLKDSSLYLISTYIFYNYYYKGNTSPIKKSDLDVIEGFTFDEMYGYYLDLYPLTNGKKTDPYYAEKYEIRGNFIKNNLEKIIKTLDPYNNIWFMSSLDDNPAYETYEKLMPIGERIGAI